MCRNSWNTALCAFVAIAGLAGCGSSGGGGAPPPTSTQPERVAIAGLGVGSQGIFDPSVALDPGTGRLWMSYSAVDPSPLWPAQNRVVAIRLAYSDDNGASWSDSGAVSGFADVTLPLAAPYNAGSWVSEVSTLVYDAGAVAAERWKLIWHRYLQINGGPRFEHGWLAMKTASTPQGLATAPEVKLFGAYGYDSGNNNTSGPTQPPVGGAPLIPLDTALDINLNTCVFTEPGLYASASALYLAVQCLRLADAERLIAVLRCSSPCNIASAASWSYLGTALNKADAAAQGGDEGFAAPAIFAAAGGVYLVATPERTAGAPWANYYSGCRVFRFADLEAASLQRSGGNPDAIVSVNGSAGSFNGACAYHAAASASGVLYSELVPSQTDSFRIFKSRVGVP